MVIIGEQCDDEEREDAVKLLLMLEVCTIKLRLPSFSVSFSLVLITEQRFEEEVGLMRMIKVSK